MTLLENIKKTLKEGSEKVISFAEDLTEKVKEVGEEGIEISKELLAEISDKTTDVANMARFKLDLKEMQKKIDQGYNVIFTGDLNQDEEELNTFLNKNQIKWFRRDASIRGKPTWGGDEWCAKLMGKPISPSQVLDYTFIAGKAKNISTKIMDSGYFGSEFRSDAISDHNLLFSTVSIG